jgi:hypothetical protein
MLSVVDQLRFHSLREHVSGRDNRYNRHQRIAVLERSLISIRSFCIRNEWSDWIRCLVCGITWLSSDEIAVNPRQLTYVLGKSKSSINGSFALMGYTAVPMKAHQGSLIAKAIPYLETHIFELRQWSVRKRMPRSALNTLLHRGDCGILTNAIDQGMASESQEDDEFFELSDSPNDTQE